MFCDGSLAGFLFKTVCDLDNKTPVGSLVMGCGLTGTAIVVVPCGTLLRGDVASGLMV